MGVNELNVVGTIFFPIPLITFILVLRSQYASINRGNYLITLFSMRAAALIPIFSFFLYIALLVPDAFAAMRVPESIMEGYAVYCFMTMIVTFCGGPKKAIEIIRSSERTGCCCAFQKNSPDDCYARIHTALWQFLYVRPWISFIGAIGFYAGSQAVYTVSSVFAALSTFWMLPGILMITHTLYDDCTGLNIIYKFVVVKVSVGLILIEDAVQAFLFSSGAVNVSEDTGDSRYDEEEKIQRIYCVVALVQFALLSIFLYAGFAPGTTAGPNTVVVDQNNSPKLKLTDQISSNGGSLRTWGDFIVDITSVFSVTCITFIGWKSGDKKGALGEALVGSEEGRFDSTF